MRYFAGFDINDTKTITYFAQPPGLGYLILLFIFKRIDKKIRIFFSLSSYVLAILLTEHSKFEDRIVQTKCFPRMKT